MGSEVLEGSEKVYWNKFEEILILRKKNTHLWVFNNYDLFSTLLEHLNLENYIVKCSKMYN